MVGLISTVTLTITLVIIRLCYSRPSPCLSYFHHSCDTGLIRVPLQLALPLQLEELPLQLPLQLVKINFDGCSNTLDEPRNPPTNAPLDRPKPVC